MDTSSYWKAKARILEAKMERAKKKWVRGHNRKKPKLTITKYKWGYGVLSGNVFIGGFKTKAQASEWIKGHRR